MSLAVFVINLDTSRERMAQIETASEKAGLSLTRVAAIDGRVEDGTRWEGFDDAAFRRRNGRNALPGEIGCYRSHLKALDRFVQSGAPHGLILEDDALPTADTASRIAAIIDAAPDADVIRLISHRNRGFIARTETSAGDRLGTTLTGPQGSAAAYLVSRRGAERLLATLLPMSLPYDVALEQFWVNGADGYSVRDDVLGRSDHRNQSTIANTSHYDAAKFRATRRVSALVFRVCDGLRRASAALMPGKLAHLVEFPPYPALGFGRSPERTMPRWLQLLPVVAVLMLLSPVWLETNAHRMALLLLATMVLTQYFLADFWHDFRPRLSIMGILSIAWAFYIMTRMGIFLAVHPHAKFSSGEGTYLIAMGYGTAGYALWRYMRRPMPIITAFMAISLAVMLYDLEFIRLLGGQAAATLHGNTVEAAIADGFILLAALTYGAHAARLTGRDNGWRPVAMLALAAAVVLVATLAVLSLNSGSVWLALAAALPVMLVAMAWHGSSRPRGRPVVLGYLVLSVAMAVATIALLEHRLVAAAGTTVDTAVELTHDITANGSLENALRAVGGRAETPASAADRLHLWANALDLWSRHPIVGNGLEWYDAWQQQPFAAGQRVDFFRNGYLEVAVRYGLIGIAFYALLFGWSIYQARRASREDLLAPAAYHLYLAAFVYFAVTMLTNSTNRLAIGEAYMLFAVAFGFYCNYRRQIAGTAPRRLWF